MAMAVAGEHLLLAGPPDCADPAAALAAVEGKRGGSLLMLSTADGGQVAEIALDAPPVFDGLAIARGRIYISTTKGDVQCLGPADAGGQTQ
jgi:hypothetical protein